MKNNSVSQIPIRWHGCMDHEIIPPYTIKLSITQYLPYPFLQYHLHTTIIRLI